MDETPIERAQPLGERSVCWSEGCVTFLGAGTRAGDMGKKDGQNYKDKAVSNQRSVIVIARHFNNFPPVSQDDQTRDLRGPKVRNVIEQHIHHNMTTILPWCKHNRGCLVVYIRRKIQPCVIHVQSRDILLVK